MNDPSAIPEVLRAVEEAWQGQADLSFGAFVTVLQNHGLEWNSTPEEVKDLCRQLALRYPGKLGPVARGYAVSTVSPKARYIITGGFVVVCGEIPAVWPLGTIVRAEVAQPLRLEDQEGTTHRFGVVHRIEKLVDPQALVVSLNEGVAGVDAYGQGTVWLRGRRDTEILQGPARVEHRELHVGTRVFTIREVLPVDSWA